MSDHVCGKAVVKSELATEVLHLISDGLRPYRARIRLFQLITHSICMYKTDLITKN